ncbi:MAG: glycosyltransferase family 4 protein [Lachnospiraceae bacterium]|nr:glycosyltransferase family 4 protein [Lachnospiraceae bacterium]MBR1524201.1 glycosyltransferase family 4 protein [Lachnospiraceae bacterium]
MILVIGDYYSGTGPALVTKYYISSLSSGVFPAKKGKHPAAVKGVDYIASTGKAARLFELLVKVPRASVLFLSGHSRQNILAMRIGKLFGKRSAYLMHGAVEYENSINKVPDEQMAEDERTMMEMADLILAVSRQFEEWLKERYPEYAGKISHVTNGIDWELIRESATEDTRASEGIISVGGGMPRKCIINVCKAVEKLNQKGHNITLTVAGDTGADSVAIDSYPFVRDIGLVSHDELMREYHKNKVFVQNSVFETFGLAPIEALLSYADVLISKECGALSVIKKTEDMDIINDPQDIDEIAVKLENLLINENHTRLLVELDKENTSWKKRAAELKAKLEGIK